MLYIIGLGLGDERDITLRGLEAIKQCDHIYLEAYTSVLPGIKLDQLENLYGKPVKLAHRETVECESDLILANANQLNVAFLVVGDPFGATTHTDLILRARQLGIQYKVIHNTSIMNAIGCTGLQLYNFGITISMVFFTETWKPDSWYDKIKMNLGLNLHTLCLLDIKVREQSVENLVRGRLIYDDPRYMTVNQAVIQMLEIEQTRSENVCGPNSLAVGIARVGTDSQVIKSGTLHELSTFDFGEPLHSLIIPARMHELELDFVRLFAVNRDTFDTHSSHLRP